MSSTLVADADTWVRKQLIRGKTIQEAARLFAQRYPEEHKKLLEEVGMWPSSEPTIRALQGV